MKLLSVDEVKSIDNTAINDWGIPADELMSRAATAALREALKRWPAPTAVWIYTGSGNNGGDGWLLGRLAIEKGLPTTVFCEPGREPRSSTAGRAKAAYLAAGGRVSDRFGTPPDGTLVVDALLGIGLSDAPRGWTSGAIQDINHHNLPVLALDCPSGLNADTGTAPGVVVNAALTVTFIAAMRGLFTGRARDYCGRIVLDDLDLPFERLDCVDPGAELLELDALLARLPQRRPSAHKGVAGHLLVIGGDHGMGGAAMMAAEAGLRCGAGLVTLATRVEHLAAALTRRPECLVHGIDDPADLAPLLSRANAVVLGPGLGQGLWGRDLMTELHNIDRPLVLDADALNLMAGGTTRLPPNTIITPHPGEAGRLLQQDTAEVEADRFAAVTALSARYGATTVLKGAGSLIADPDARMATGVCPCGNAGMASGGMGDVLSGILGSLLAQGLDAPIAARLGVMVHSVAADLAVRDTGPRGLLATDLLPFIRQLLNGRGRSQN